MSRELIHQINDALDRIDAALMQGELLHDAIIATSREYPHLAFGANEITEIIRDVERQLKGIREEMWETPVMVKYRQYMAAYAMLQGETNVPDEFDQRHYKLLTRIEGELHALPSMNAKDMAIKMVVGHSFGDLTCLDYDGEVWAEARALVADIALGDTAAKIKDAA